MTWPKAMLSIEVYDPPKKGDWHKAKYLVHATEDGLWTDSLDDALGYMRDAIMKEFGPERTEEQTFEDFITEPKGKVLIKAKSVSKESGGDTKWNLVTAYMISDELYKEEEDRSVFMMFSSKGSKNDRGVEVPMSGRGSIQYVFKDSNSGNEITPKQAIDIITGNVKPKQPKEKKNGRHNDKKADRREVQKVRPVRDRVKRDPKLARLPNKRSKNTD